MSDERTYFANANGVRIGTSRLVFGSTAYATRNVTSASILREGPPMWPGYLVMAIGGVMFFYGLLAGSVWGFIGVAGIMSGQFNLLRRRAKLAYGIRIVTPKGPVIALASRNRTYIQQVTTAVLKAVAAAEPAAAPPTDDSEAPPSAAPAPESADATVAPAQRHTPKAPPRPRRDGARPRTQRRRRR